MTTTVATAVAALLEKPDADHYGLALMRSTGLASGTLYPVLARLREAGWIEARWEGIDPVAAGRPARRYYRLTPDGAVLARRELAALHRRVGLSGRLAGGEA